MVARLLILTSLLSALVLPASATLAQVPLEPGPIVDDDTPPTISELTPRWIIELAQPPLAQAPLGEVYAVQSVGQVGRGRLQVESPAAQQYITQLRLRQAQLFANLQAIFPAAELHRQYQVVFNGIGIAIPGADASAIEALRALPGVAQVYPDQAYQPQMYSSVVQIGASTLWAAPAIGGQQNAGAGIKIAIIDQGIKVDNPFFNPAGFSYPEGFPKGDVAYTTPKVIVARAYYRPDAPPLPGNESPEPGPIDSSHGTHVAGIAAGVANTRAVVAGVERTISGVAPRAYLMNYKAFYVNGTVFSGSAFGIELIAALEDAVIDGADVINNSWGGRPSDAPPFDPIVRAAEAAVDAGVVVVFAAGNAGPDQSTFGSPSYSEKVISVGAVTTPQAIGAGFVDTAAPEGAPATLRNRPFGRAGFGPQIGADTVIGPAAVLPVASLTGSTLACEPLPAGSLSGQIALIERGTCPFSLKVFHVQQGGALAAIIYNTEEGGEQLIAMAPGERAEQVVIPAVSVGRSVGLALLDWYQQHTAATRVAIDGRPNVFERTPDVMADFSSRGPSFQGSLKPDIVAPGVTILSAGFGSGIGSETHLGFGQVSGTSMASPQVAGSAALLRQVHPDWTPADVKSALVTTASPAVWLDEARTQPASVLERGGGRISVDKAAYPGLLFDRPALSFGAVAALPGQPTRSVLAVGVRNVSGAPQTYSLSPRPINGSALAVSVAPATLTLEPSESARFEVTVEVPADAPFSDYEALVELSGSQPLSLPVWVRTKPASFSAKVLLLDNDGSSNLGLPDYAGYYGNLLVEQNISFVYLDADAHAGQERVLPELGEVQRYEVVLWFTGNNDVPSGAQPQTPTALSETDQNTLIAYLQGGGNLIAIGQNLTQASDINTDPPDDPRYGRSDLYHYYLGARFVQEDVFADTSRVDRTIVGTGVLPWLSEVTLDLRVPDTETSMSDATAAGNQSSIDEVAIIDIDPRQPDLFAVPILHAAVTRGLKDGIVGVSRFDGPNLEAPEPGIPYRTVYLSFGLEGVRSDTGFTSRKMLLQNLLYWIIDRPSVQIDKPADTTVGETVVLGAEAATNTPASFVRYRWDFGDGSPISETQEPSNRHVYSRAGSYVARVEVTDSWGHTALSGVPIGVAEVPGASSASISAPSLIPAAAVGARSAETGRSPASMDMPPVKRSVMIRARPL